MKFWNIRINHKPVNREARNETYDDVYTAMGSMILNAFSGSAKN